MKRSSILCVLAGSALSLNAQQTFSGPASGYVFDTATHSVRAVLGVPGAAYLGSASQADWDSVSVAPNGQWALGASGLLLSWISDLSQPASFTSLMQAPGPITRIVWSVDSTAATVWSPTVGVLQRITGLGTAPVVHDPIDLTALGGSASGWSLSPDGQDVALYTEVSGAVYLSLHDAAPTQISSVANPGAMAFSADGTSLFVLGGAEPRILQLDVATGALAGSFDVTPFESTRGVAPAPAKLALHPVGRLSPSGIQALAASPDGAHLYAIGGEKLCAYDLSTAQTLQCSDLDISPTSFEPMPGGILLLNYLRSGSMPIWLLNTKSGQTSFVPSETASANASF